MDFLLMSSNLSVSRLRNFILVELHFTQDSAHLVNKYELIYTCDWILSRAPKG